MAPPPSLSTCAKNVALLHLLHPVPAPPSRNMVDERTIRHDGYTLPFSHERKLVGVLAFLSSLTDDPNHIPAVCVEEKCDSKSLQVLLAVNKDSYQDGSETLALIKEAFQSLFVRLGQVSDAKQSENREESIFEAIISICSARILCRLRLIANARKTSRQAFKTALETAIASVRRLRGKKGQDANMAVECFVNSAKHVIKLVDAWTSYRSDGPLKELVLGVHQLSRIEGFPSLLDRVPHWDMDPCLKQSLVNMVRKVSRYRDAARFLYRSAKKRPITRHMEVVLVQLPHEAFQRAETTNHHPSLASALARSQIAQNRARLNHLCHLLQPTVGEAKRRFEKQTLDTLRKGKIHAEVQILAHCELTSPSKRPRVICSSKSACYLCNALLSIFDKVHSPHCHGRLYPRWLLPAIPALGGMQERLNDLLGKQINDSLTTLLRRGEKTTYPYPNESVLLTLASSSATTITTSFVAESSDAIHSPFLVNDDAVESGSRSAESEPCQTAAGDATDGLSVHGMGAENNESHNALACPVDSRKSIEFIALDRMRPTVIKPGAASRIYQAGLLEVHVDMSSAGRNSKTDANIEEAACRLEWLTEEEAQTLKEKKPCLFIDIESLQPGDELRVQSQSCFYMTARGSFLRVRFP